MEQEPVRILAANAAAERLLGYSRDRLLGLTLGEISPSDRQPELRAALQALGQAERWRGPWELLAANGERVSVEASLWRGGSDADTFIQGSFRVPPSGTRRQRRREQLVAIREVAAELTRELDLTRLLGLIIERIVGLVWPTSAILRIWDQGTKQLVPLATRRYPPHTELAAVRLGEGASGIAAKEQRMIVVDDYAIWPDALPGLRERCGVTAAVAVPMIYQSRLVGVITLARYDGDPPFDQNERDLLALFADQAAIAIENARLFEGERERRQQLKAVRDVAAEITDELDLTTLLGLIWRRAATLVGGDRGVLFLWDEGQKCLRPWAWSEGSDWASAVKLKLGEGVCGWVAQHRQGAFVNDYRGSVRALPVVIASSDVRAFLAEPILYRGRLVGVIAVGRSTPDRPFAPRDRETLGLFARHAAIAIENARLFEQEQNRRRQLEATREVTAEIARELDLDRLLKLTFQRASELVRGSLGWVFLWDEPSKTLVPRAWSTAARQERKHPVQLGQGVTGVAAQSRRGVIVNDYPNWPPALRNTSGGVSYAAMMASPILYQGRLIGVITITRIDAGDPFTDDELSTLTTFANHAAIAIENARLYAQEQNQRRQLEAIRELTSEVIRELDLETVLDLTIRRAVTLTGGRTGVIYVWDEGSRLMKPRALVGLGPISGWPSARFDQGVTGRAAKLGTGLIENDYANSPYRRNYVYLRARPRAALSAPILYKGRLVGAITIGRTTPGHPFGEDDLASLCLFASYAAIAVEHARLYEELSRRAEEMQELVRKVYRAQDEERRRFAFEVHDGLAQTAAATHQHLEALATVVRPRSEAGRRELREARTLAQRTVREARRVIAGLRPTVLDDLGLASAVRVEVDALRAEGRAVDYQENLGSRRLPAVVETALFSVAREALTNVRKHAAAKHVGIVLTLSDAAVTLQVRDTGSGFDLASVERSGNAGEHIGLRGMEERVAWLGGTLEIKSRRGRGTSVRATVPIPSERVDG